MSDAPDPKPLPPHRWVGMVTLGVYVLTGFFPYIVSGLLMPIAALVLLMACWGFGLALTARLALRKPLLSPFAIPAALFFWWGYVTAGSALFGWSA
jgi:hypothetical protein